MNGTAQHVVSIGLSAAIVSVVDEQPSVLVVHHAATATMPCPSVRSIR